MTIEVYETIDDKCITVVEKGTKDEDCHILIREITGTDYNDCMKQHHELMGWEPYIPF